MRTIAEIQSLNWRMILVITICFMGFYFLIVDEGSLSPPGEELKSPKAVTPIYRPGKPTVAKPGDGKKTGGGGKDFGPGRGKDHDGEWREVKVESKVKTEWDDRFEGVAPVENPYPVLGDQFDSPSDAFPGRLRPEEGNGEESVERVSKPVAQPEKPKEKPKPKPAKPSPKPKEKNPLPKPESINAETPTPPSIKPPSDHAKALQSKAASLPSPSLTPQPNQFSPDQQQAREDSNYVAICAALKNVPLDLPEWLVHHYNHLQIHHFYIMDDGSNPPLSTIPSINLGVPPGAVHFDYQDQSKRGKGHSQQLLIYQRCLDNWGDRHKWMIFIDGDEFLEMTAGNETLLSFLKEKEAQPDVGAVAVNWRMHTSSGLLTRPESVRKAFVECIWDGPGSNNSHVKSIVRTDVGVRPSNPHLWDLEEGYRTVGESGDAVESEAFRVPVTRERIGVHHYAGKSREEYVEKMGRGNAMDDPKGEAFWDSLEHKLPHVGCPEMAEYDP